MADDAPGSLPMPVAPDTSFPLLQGLSYCQARVKREFGTVCTKTAMHNPRKLQPRMAREEHVMSYIRQLFVKSVPTSTRTVVVILLVVLTTAETEHSTRFTDVKVPGRTPAEP